jgi:hypothetical protein
MIDFERMPPKLPPPTVICSLVCHRHVDMAIICLGSIARLCEEPVSFRIHDDGTLTEEDCDRLSIVGSVDFVHRRQADELMGSLLKNMPNCLALREELPLALKLLDTILLAPSDEYAFVDSDVLFLKRFANPFRCGLYPSRVAFMRDREHSYCLRSWNAASSTCPRLPAKVNTGIVVFDRSQFDLEFVEWFLSQPFSKAIPPMREQTAWAFLGKKRDCQVFDESQIRVMRENESDCGLVAGHFTAKTRHLLPQYRVLSEDADLEAQPIRIQTKPCGTCTAIDIAWYEIRRAWQKLRSR